MKAYYLHAKEDLRPRDIATPDPGPGEVLVEVLRVGICGSDVEYFVHGCCGAFRPSEPFILGHELMGRIAGLGRGVTGPAVGQRVAVDPARPCGGCRACREGRRNLCSNMRFLGSASTTPPSDGGLRQYLALPAENAHPLSDRVGDAEAALLEPLSVALHAVRRAGPLIGSRVLVTGGGTIGQLVALVARRAGAAAVAVSEPRATRRERALRLGASEVFDPAREALPGGAFDVVFEASGAAAALRRAIEVVRPGGSVVQIGTLPASVDLPANLVMTGELQLFGSFRFTTDFGDALALLETGVLDVRPIVTRTFAFGETPAAFAAASRPSDELKIQVEVAPTQGEGR